MCSDEVNNFLLSIACKPFFFSFTLDMGKNKVDFVTGLCEFYLCLLLSQGRINYQQLKSLILEPGKSSSAPYSSPLVSPPSSPRDTPVATR